MTACNLFVLQVKTIKISINYYKCFSLQKEIVINDAVNLSLILWIVNLLKYQIFLLFLLLRLLNILNNNQYNLIIKYNDQF